MDQDRKHLKNGPFQRQETTYAEHCCVPHCTASAKFNGVLSFHGFPSQTDVRSRWIVNIRRDAYVITTHSKVCSRHFSPDKLIEPTTPQGRRRLAKGAVATLFEWIQYTVETPRRGVWERVDRFIETDQPSLDCSGLLAPTQTSEFTQGKSLFHSHIFCISLLLA